MSAVRSAFRKVTVPSAAAVAAVMITFMPAFAEGPVIGAPAPTFTGKTANGGTVSLQEFQGRTVILEWTNDGCPFVKKHYSSDNMQALQRETTGQGMVWLTVISSAPGTQGYAEGPQALQIADEAKASPSEIILDPEGTIGRLYDARVTPHMYIVDPSGTLVYKGGIDDRPTANPADIDGATNYVRVALDELAAGQPVSNPVTRPYGCTVKYPS